ncbi:hypothetical protein ACJX0J_018288, partial [Zea mays]
DLLLDRHDIRHLLDRVPPPPRRAYSVALLSTPSPDGRYLDVPAGDGEYEGSGDAAPSDTEQVYYNVVPFSYGCLSGSDELNYSDLCYPPPFYVPESLLNKLPPSEKAHQIIARTTLFVSEHGGRAGRNTCGSLARSIVLRVKQGDNPTFGFLMPDHHLHIYFRYLVDHPQLLKDDADAVGTNKGSTEREHASSGGALSLLGTTYDSGDEDEGTLPRSPDVQGHVKPASIMPDKEELGKDQTAPLHAVKSKTILMKKNLILTGHIIVVQREKKIIEFILTNGKEFEEKLIEQDRTTGRFPFLMSSNPCHSYYLKFLQETEESKSHGRSPNHKDKRDSCDRRNRRNPESDDRSSLECADNGSREFMAWYPISIASDRSSAGPSEKQLYDKQGNSRFHLVVGLKLSPEPIRKVNVNEAAAIVMVMVATCGLGAANDSLNTMKGTKDNVRTHFNALSERISNGEADASLTGTAAAVASKEADSSEASMTKEQKLKAERLRRAKMFAAIIKSGDKKMNDLAVFAAIIKSGDKKMNDLAASSDPTSEAAKAIPDMNVSGLDQQSVAKEREGSSDPFEHEGPNLTNHNKDSDDEPNRVRKYRKKHRESHEEKDESEDIYKHSRKRHHPEHSRGPSKDVHKHKHKSLK